MNLKLSAPQAELQKRADAFLQHALKDPKNQNFDSGREFPTALYQGLADEGFLGLPFPEVYGGAGASALEVSLLAETLSEFSYTLVNIYLVQSVFAGSLLRSAGTEEQKQKFIPELIAGKLRFSFALTEPGAGSDAGSVACEAKLDGDQYLLNGEKYLTTGALSADYILAVVKIGESFGVLIVPRTAPGVNVRAIEALAGNAYPPCHIQFRDVRIRKENLLGGGETGILKHLANTADLERLSVAASAVGGAARIVRLCKKFAKGRTQFGKKIFEFQAVQHRLANMATGLEAMRQLSRWAAWRKSQTTRAFKEASMAKLFCSEQMQEIAKNGMQIFGGRSFDADFEMQRLMRESHLALFAGGTSEIQRNLIARFV